jgi:molybdate transport system ATP-binding protein
MTDSATMQLQYVLDRGRFSLNVAAEIPLHGVSGVYGESGAGKTTLLRCIAGLEQADEGDLIVAGERWQGAGYNMPVHEREIAYVFQEPRLFPHLNVRDNIEYGWRRRKHQGGVTIDDVVQLLGLGEFLPRWPAELSGGEAQRVAIARALLRTPRFVLMDEPLASLDAARKAEILPFLERLHAELAVPIIYVSHSIDEICRLCDHLLVLADGRVAAAGELQSVLTDLSIPALAGEAAGSVIAGKIAEFDREFELSRVDFSGGQFWLPGILGTMGDSLRLRIRASDISLTRDKPGQSTIQNLLDVVIEEIQDTPGPTQLVRVAAGQAHLIARITRRSREELKLQPGDKVVAQVKAAAVRGPKIGEAEK